MMQAIYHYTVQIKSFTHWFHRFCMTLVGEGASFKNGRAIFKLLLTLQVTKMSCDAVILNKLIFYQCNAETIDNHCDISTRNITFYDLQESPLLQQGKLNFHNKMITIATVPVSIYEYMAEFRGGFKLAYLGGVPPNMPPCTRSSTLTLNLPKTLPPLIWPSTSPWWNILVTHSK